MGTRLQYFVTSSSDFYVLSNVLYGSAMLIGHLKNGDPRVFIF